MQSIPFFRVRHSVLRSSNKYLSSKRCYIVLGVLQGEQVYLSAVINLIVSEDEMYVVFLFATVVQLLPCFLSCYTDISCKIDQDTDIRFLA